MKRMTSNEYNPCFNCNFYSSCSHIRENFPVCPERARYDRLAAIEDILGDEYDLDELKKMVQAKREGRCVVLPEGGCEDKDGENALKSAMNTCFYHNNPVTRFIADAVAEKLTREEAEAALRRDQDG